MAPVPAIYFCKPRPAAMSRRCLQCLLYGRPTFQCRVGRTEGAIEGHKAGDRAVVCKSELKSGIKAFINA